MLNVFATSSKAPGTATGSNANNALEDHGSQTLAGDHSKPCAHQLHGRHERKREERGPEPGVAKGGPCNRIGGNAGRIVVGGASDQSGPEIFKELLERGWCRNVSGLIGDCHAAEVPAKERSLRISFCDRPFGRRAAHLEVKRPGSVQWHHRYETCNLACAVGLQRCRPICGGATLILEGSLRPLLRYSFDMETKRAQQRFLIDTGGGALMIGSKVMSDLAVPPDGPEIKEGGDRLVPPPLTPIASPAFRAGDIEDHFRLWRAVLRRSFGVVRLQD